MMRSGYVYRAFAADGSLLYVGASVVPGSRFSSHQSQTEWWDEVANLTIERFPSRDEALIAENHAIADENPRYNVVVDRFRVTPADAAERAARAAHRRAERAQEEAQWRHESWLATSYVPRLPVHCTNCGRRPERLPKGKTVEELICKECRCSTLRRMPEREARHLKSVAPGQATLDIKDAA